MELTAEIRTEKRLFTEIYKATASECCSAESYNGTYEVIPKAASQELETANKLLEENIKVLAIPFYEVSNKDGTTVIIAD